MAKWVLRIFSGGLWTKGVLSAFLGAGVDMLILVNTVDPGLSAGAVTLLERVTDKGLWMEEGAFLQGSGQREEQMWTSP